ncbi:MAG: hypothetical protein ACJAT1_001085 [Marivirga sp.]|jgi:hypothetical protein
MKAITKINPILFLCCILFPMGLTAQQTTVSVSGNIKDKASGEALPFVNIVLKKPADTSLITGTLTNYNGLFPLAEITSGEYLLEASYIGFNTYTTMLFVGANSEYLNIGSILLEQNIEQLQEVLVTGQQDAVSGTLDKKHMLWQTM